MDPSEIAATEITMVKQQLLMFIFISDDKYGYTLIFC